MTIFFFVQFWLDKLYLTKFARKPPHYHANLHNAMIKILPWCTFLHCGFSLWAYGNPEIWPESVESKLETNSEGEQVTRHYVNDRDFGERIFNENSLPHFILLCILFTLYTIELFSENFMMKAINK